MQPSYANKYLYVTVRNTLLILKQNQLTNMCFLFPVLLRNGRTFKNSMSLGNIYTTTTHTHKTLFFTFSFKGKIVKS